MRKSWLMRKLIILILFVIAAAAPLNCAKSSSTADGSPGKELIQKESAAAASALEPASVSDVLVLGKPTPDFVLYDIDGKKYGRADFKGRPFIIAFWHPTCNLCLDQLKELENELAAKKASVTILAVTVDSGADKNAEAVKTLAKRNIKALPLFDRDNVTARPYEMTRPPFYALVGADGRLQAGGFFLVKQLMRTMSFVDMAALAAGGGEVPVCEFASSRVPPEYENLVGKEAPIFRLPGADGNDQSPLFYRGFTRLLLIFWSPGCPHCKSQLPRVEHFARTRAQNLGVSVMGVASLPAKGDKNTPVYVDAVKQIIVQKQLTFPTALDYGGSANTMYEIKGVPSMYLIGMDGKVEFAWRGEFIFAAEAVECAIEQLDSAASEKLR